MAELRLVDSYESYAQFRALMRDFEETVRREWTDGEKAAVLEWAWSSLSPYAEVSLVRRCDRFIIYQEGHPIGMAAVKVDCSAASVNLFWLYPQLQHQEWVQEPLEALWDHYGFAHPQMQRMYVGLDALCRFDGDREILEELEYQDLNEYRWMVLDLRQFSREGQPLSGYYISPWQEKYRSQVMRLDLEMPLMLGPLRREVSPRLDREASRIAWCKEQVCGACIVQRPGVHRNALISYLFVSEPHRGHGLGCALLVSSLINLKSRGVQTIGLSVIADNEPAWTLYCSLGFTASIYSSLSCWREKRLPTAPRLATSAR